MLTIMIAAASLLGASPPLASSAVVVTNPDWLKKPSAEDVLHAWPLAAYRKHVDGGATLVCIVTTTGALDDCRIKDESPPGLGFGAAALSMAPMFQMRAGTVSRAGGAPQPRASRVTIPTRFRADPSGPPRSREHELYAEEVMVAQPVWTAAPTFEDMAAAWPAGATAASGRVVLDCVFHHDGALKGCESALEEPRGQGFAKSARGLAGRFRLSPVQAAGADVVHVRIPFSFVSPAGQAFRDRRIAEPRWLVALDPAAAPRLFPPTAAAAGLASGLGRARCVVAADGQLSQCAPVAASPEGMGFSETAVTIAQALKINPWTDEGGPVNGALVTLPVRFDLAGATRPGGGGADKPSIIHNG